MMSYKTCVNIILTKRMENKSLLSICIPTYNRASYLEQILDKMYDVCINNHIHIFISDNASQDNTQEVVDKYLKNSSLIHYFRQQSNIGPDDNFEYVLKMSTTKYRWLMSDTCYIDELDTLISDLETNELDGCVLSAPRLRSQYLPSEKICYNDSISVMRDMGWHLSWISCMIYNEKIVNSMNFDRYRFSSFNQTALMFETTAGRDCKILFHPRVIVKNVPSEVKDSAWHYHVFDVMYRQWYLMIMSLPLYYPYEIKKKCVEDNSRCSLVLRLYFQAERRMDRKWSFKDVYRNRFFIKQAKGCYKTLLLLGICPPTILKCLFYSIKECGHLVNVFFRTVGIKTIAPY